jgi:mannosyltransferase OCH1-like enzyme
MYTHFYFVDIFPTATCAFCKARSDWLQLPLAALHINRHRVTSKIRLTMPMMKMSRADRNPWLVKMIEQIQTSIIHIAPCSQEIIDNENPICLRFFFWKMRNEAIRLPW